MRSFPVRKRALAFALLLLTCTRMQNAGSDAVAGLHGRNAREIERLVRAGLTPAGALRAATSDAARLLGLEGKVGELKPGLFADIIAVPGDPLADITSVGRVAFMMKGGRVVKQS